MHIMSCLISEPVRRMSPTRKITLYSLYGDFKCGRVVEPLASRSHAIEMVFVFIVTGHAGSSASSCYHKFIF